jgi:site-specific recombinase XerD
VTGGATGGDAALIALFLDMLAAERGAARNTLLAYGRDLHQASDWLDGGLARADMSALAQLSAHWAGLARASGARKASAVRQFLGFLAGEGHRADNPGRDLASAQAARPLPKSLDSGDVDRLFTALADMLAKDPNPRTLRLAALIELLYGSGLRATELVSLPRHAVRPGRGFLVVTGKGDKERLVPISTRADASSDTLGQAQLQPGSYRPANKELLLDLADAGLRMNELRSAAELHAFVVDETTEVLGAERVLTYTPGAGLPSGAAAVIDTWALSLCDDAVLTYPKSTFGFVGALLAPTGLPPHVVVSGSKTSGECVRLTSTEPVFHGWFMRWFAQCYARDWETGDMLNQESAYFCLMQPGAGPPATWPTHACPASDAADGLLYVQSPFDYEALDELGDAESFFGDAQVTRKQLMARFEGPYRDFVARAGAPAYGVRAGTGEPVRG